MIINLRKAAQLCTESEFALVGSARADKLRGASLERLELQIARARRLRDRFRGLAERQKREALGRVPPRGKRPARGNARTVEKEELFREVLRRFESRAEKLKASEAILQRAPKAPATRARPRRRPGIVAAAAPLPRRPGAPARAAKKRSTEPRSNRSARQRSTAALAVRKESQMERSHATRQRSHVGARNRRSQARRDAR